jgi:Domain of unknown function (DUF6134)
MLTLMIISLIRKILGNKYAKYIPDPSRKTMKIIIIIVTFVTFTFSKVFSQNNAVNFSIYKDNHKIGTIISERVESNDITRIVTVTKVKVKLIFTVYFNESRTVTYHDNRLYAAELHRNVSRFMNNYRSTISKGNWYEVRANSEISKHKRKITSCVSDLYFDEPIKTKYVYSEYWQRSIKVVKVSDHKYQTKYPDNTSTTFNYKNGYCTGFITDTKYGRITTMKDANEIASKTIK